MKCPRCQYENRPGAKFCEECAAPLARACANCGAQLSPTAKFCSECAHPAGQAAPSTSQRFGAPEAYTPKHLAEKILTSKAALEGERKQVTVLFADLKGSMELLADRDPEEARKLLDPVLEHMMEAVHRYEGTVNQVMGDGIMALFGAPLAHEDHAVRACYAALRMQDSGKRYAEAVRRTAGIPIQIRVGLNSGEVVVRSIGSDLRMDYTAVGQTTHLAARMEQMAVPGSILISADTLTLAEGYVQIKPLGPLPVKGLPAPIEVYEVTGTATVRSRLHAAAATGLTRFVGRDSEMEQLRQALERARAAHGQVVAVVGEAGVGKSRLAWELARSRGTEGWLVLETTAVSYGQATPYLPVIDLLGAYFQIDKRDDARKVREKVTGKLLALDRALEPALVPVLALLDVRVDDAAWEALDPPKRRHRTVEAVKRLLLRETQLHPLLLIVEDLHWLDSATQALLDRLVESLPSTRLVLLVNYRPEYRHAWGSKTYYTQVRMDPLPAEGAGELLRSLLGDDVSLVGLQRRLIEWTEGNPFFLEETVRTLVETGALVGDRGARRLVTPLERIAVPVTVQAILAARIDRLPTEERRLLQSAAVIGEDIASDLLLAVSDQPDTEVRRQLGHLQDAEFLYEASLFPDPRYAFKHVLTREVAGGGLLHDQRRTLHARVVDAIERLYADRAGEYLDRLAYHAFNGGLWDKAVTYLRQVGVKAAARSANPEAVVHFEQALAALAHLPDALEGRELGIDLRLGLRNALHAIGQFQRTLQPLREAEALAEALEDRPRLGRIAACLSQYFRLVDDLDRSIESAERGLAIADAVGDFVLQLVSRVALGQSCHALGEYARATETLQWNVAALTGDLARERFGQVYLPAALSRAWLARCLADLGQFAQGSVVGEEAVRIAEAEDHPFSIVTALFGVGYLYLRQGDVDRALPLLERSVALCEAWQFRSWYPPVASALGAAYLGAGDIDAAWPLLQEAVERAMSMGLMGRHSVRLAALSEAHLVAGQLDAALDLATQALALCRHHRERGNEAWALRLLGELAARRDPLDVEAAEGHYREALALATRLEMRPLVAHCHLGLGKLSRRTGRREQAQEQFTTATTMYREMEMRFWLNQAETEMRGLA